MRKRLESNWDDSIYHYGALTVPGIVGEIDLITYCGCVNNSNDDEGEFQTADEDCDNCNGTGIEITENGYTILNLIKIADNRKTLPIRSA